MRVLAVAIVAFLWALAPVGAGPKVQTISSPGGIEIWLAEQRGLPIVNVEAAFRGGRSLEPKGKAGLARLTTYLMDEGAGDLDAQAFMAALSDKAINFSVSEEAELLKVSISALKEVMPEAVRLGALAMTAPRFDAAPVQRMKNAILVEQAQIEDDPVSKADLVWWQTAFPQTPYGISAAGTPASIKAMSRQDLRAFHGRAFARSRLVVVMTGDLDAAEAGQIADGLFGGLPRGERYAPGDQLTLAPPVVTVLPRDVPQTAIVFGLPAIRRDHPDFRALHTLNYMLGGGSFASRLMQEVRVKRGLVYSVSTSVTTLDRAGVLYGTLATKNETAGEALSVVRAEIARLRDTGPSPEELADAKAYLTGAWPLAFDSNASIAAQLLAMRLNGLPSNYGDLRNAEVEALTVERLREVARKYLDPQRLVVVALGTPQGVKVQ